MAYFGENAFRAWGKFDYNGAIQDSFGLSSVNDVGTGVFRFNMSTTTNSNYCVLAGYAQTQRTNPNRVWFVRTNSINSSAFEGEINIGHGGTADVDNYFVGVVADG